MPKHSQAKSQASLKNRPKPLRVKSQKNPPEIRQRYYSVEPSPIGALTVVTDDEHLLAISFGRASKAELSGITEVADHAPAIHRNTCRQLQEYFAGKRQQFDLAVAPQGTAFQRQVWQALTEIPFGQTASYLNIATAIGNEKACRAVGAANGKNPIPIVIPCHRVIGADGSLTGFAGGLRTKVQLLSLEGWRAPTTQQGKRTEPLTKTSTTYKITKLQ